MSTLSSFQIMRVTLLLLTVDAHLEFEKAIGNQKCYNTIVGHVFDDFSFKLLLEKIRVIFNFFYFL